MVTIVLQAHIYSLTIIDSIHRDLIVDEFTNNILNQIVLDHASCSSSKYYHKYYNKFKWHKDFLFQNKLLYIPSGHSQLQVSQHCLDMPMVGNFEANKILESKVLVAMIM